MISKKAICGCVKAYLGGIHRRRRCWEEQLDAAENLLGAWDGQQLVVRREPLHGFFSLLQKLHEHLPGAVFGLNLRSRLFSIVCKP